MSEEDMVQEAVETVQDAVEKIDPATTATVMRNVGSGFFALALTVATASIAVGKFRTAYDVRNKMLKAAASETA